MNKKLGLMLTSVAVLGLSACNGGKTVKNWPAKELSQWLKDCEVEGVTIPGLDLGGEYTYESYEAEGYGLIAAISIEDAGTPGEDSLEDKYLAVLEAANWEIDDTYYDSYGYFADDPTGQVEAQFFTDGGEFDLWFSLVTEAPSGWPAEELAGYLLAAEITGVTIPEIDIGEYTYAQGYTQSGAFVAQIQAADAGTVGVDSFEDQYVAAVTAANWTVDDSDYEEAGYFAVDPTEQLKAQFFSYSGTFLLQFSVNVPLRDGWPTQEVASLLETLEIEGVTVPSIELVGYTYSESQFSDSGLTGFINCADEGTPGVDSYEDDYCAALTAAGWTIDDSKYDEEGYYAIDPTEQVEVFFYSYSDQFKCYIYDANYSQYEFVGAFPSDIVAAFIADELGVTGVNFPALGGATWSYGIDEYGSLVLVAEDVFYNDVCAALDAAGWTSDDSLYDYFGINFYNDPNLSVNADVYDYGTDGVRIDIYEFYEF